MIDPTTGEQTEINEKGPKVTPQEVELFVDKLLYLAKGASLCVFAGSLPREVDTDIYAFLIRELRKLNVTTVVDTSANTCGVAVGLHEPTARLKLTTEGRERRIIYDV